MGHTDGYRHHHQPTARRLLAFALLLTVAGALLLPAIASASPTHFTKVYKIEKQLDLNGHQSAHEHLYCEAGDYAIDGMWRVDNVDQANPRSGSSATCATSR